MFHSSSSDSVATNLNPSPAPSTPKDPKKLRAEKVDKATEAFRKAITSKRVRKATQALQEAIQAAGTQRALLEELQSFLALPGRVEWLLDTEPKTHSDLLVKVFGKNDPFLDQLSGKFSEESQGYLESKKYEKARQAASRALLLNDADMEARKSRSLAYIGERQYLEAIPDLEILRKQHQSELLFHLAMCYLHTQQLEKARQTAEEFRQATPENPDGYRLRAKILIEQGDFRGAILDLQEVMKLDNPNGVARFKILQMLSKAHYGLGDLWRACLYELQAVKFADQDYARGQHPQQLTDLLNGHLAKLQTSQRLPYDLDFRVMPPTGNLQSRVQVAFPWPNDHQWKNRDNLWGLRMFIGGQSAFEARFQLSSSEIARGIQLRLDHVSTNRPDGLRDGRISLWINDSLIEKNKNLCGKAQDPYQCDITKMCKPGNNSVKIRFAENSQTQYWLRRVQISSR
jgi:tetratricopeptide (TPR) repeat protein